MSDGGPAFPFVEMREDEATVCDGMSLRDWFAGRALTGVFFGPDFDYEYDYVAKACYAMADAMLKERAK